MIRRCFALLGLTVVCARFGRDKVTHSPLRTDPPIAYIFFVLSHLFFPLLCVVHGVYYLS